MDFRRFLQAAASTGFLLFAIGMSSTGFAATSPSGIFEFPEKDSSTAVKDFLSRAETLLPKDFLQGLPIPLRVRFEKLDNLKALRLPKCEAAPSGAIEEKHSVAGEYKADGHELILNQSFLPIIEGGEGAAPSYPCGHQNAYRLALATVLHETAHAYDSGSKRGMISGTREFRRLTGFMRKAQNHLADRSPDPYELVNPRESFAVNFEFFMLDPDYKCRKPLLHAHLARTLGGEPYSGHSCEPFRKILMHSKFAKGVPLVEELDPARVYQIHYLFAAKGKEMMSRWGHAMFRVVICAPERKTVGPECLRDLPYHVVVSFRANANDLILSGWKGLRGKYPSQLFLLPMIDVIDEYSKLEFRDLKSVPLKLDEQQKSDFLLQVLDQYWSYQGSYFFLTNNCASEADHLLQRVLLTDSRLPNGWLMTPLGLYKKLETLGITDTASIRDKRAAINQGYYFPSKKTDYTKPFKKLQMKASQAHVDFPFGAFDDWMSKSTASDRRELYAKLHGEEDFTLAATFLILESYQLSAQDHLIETQTSAKLQKLQEGDPTLRSLQDGIQLLARQTMPWTFLKSGYGIPLVSEIGTASRSLDPQALEATQLRIGAWLQENLGEEIRVREQIQANMALFQRGAIKVRK